MTGEPDVADNEPKTAAFVWLLLLGLSCAALFVHETHSGTEWVTLASAIERALSFQWTTVLQLTLWTAAVLAGVNFALLVERSPGWAIAICVIAPLACVLMQAQ